MVFFEIDFINVLKIKVRVLFFLSFWRGKYKERIILRLLVKYIVMNLVVFWSNFVEKKNGYINW